MNNNNKRKVYSVTTMTPHRISFAGGGTDYEDFYKKFGGKVINSTINKHLFVTLQRHSELHDEKYRLMYSRTELRNNVKKIENNVARECLKLVPVDPPILISTSSDIPASSGLGSSASFAVGLLNALHCFRGERVSSSQLAEEACHVEIKSLKFVCGKQDQYAAAFGGLNKFIFKKNGLVLINPIKIKGSKINNFFENSLLIWTGVQRKSEVITKSYNLMDKKKVDNLQLIKGKVDLFQKELEMKNINLKNVGELLNSSWQSKKKISKEISSNFINDLYNKTMSSGSLGGKILGAGGGGFILSIVSKQKQKKLKSKLKKYKTLNFAYEPKGTQIISVIYK